MYVGKWLPIGYTMTSSITQYIIPGAVIQIVYYMHCWNLKKHHHHIKSPSIQLPPVTNPPLSLPISHETMMIIDNLWIIESISLSVSSPQHQGCCSGTLCWPSFPADSLYDEQATWFNVEHIWNTEHWAMYVRNCLFLKNNCKLKHWWPYTTLLTSLSP